MADSKYAQRFTHREVRNPQVRVFHGLALLLIVVSVGGLSLLSGSPQVKSGAMQSTGTPQAAPDEALKQLRATEEALLTTYGWADRENGVVRIPIDRAMELLLERGLPARKPEEQPIQEF
jgi:hypothetical protein